MLCGINEVHIKILCENEFNGGFGYSLNEVAEMTLDQVIFLFVQGTSKKKSMSVESAASMADKDGLIKGVDSKGKDIKLPWLGKSLAKRIQDGEIAFDMEGNRVPVKKEESKPLTQKEQEQITRQQNRERRAKERKDRSRRRELEKMVKEHKE